MASHQKSDTGLAAELEAIATAAADQLRAQVEVAHQHAGEQRQRLADAASLAIAAGLPLRAIANAEQIGQARARDALGKEVLRRVERAARRKREADYEYHEAVVRAARLGLSYREVGSAADIAHGTVRAMVARAGLAAADGAPSPVTMAMRVEADGSRVPEASEAVAVGEA